MTTALEAYLQQQQANQQQTLGNIQIAQGLATFQQNAAKLAREQQYRQELAALGANPTQEQLVGLAARYGSPDKVMDVQQKSLDRQTALDAQKEAKQAQLAQQKALADERLAQQNQFATMMHEYRMAQAKTAEERAAELARHNKQVEVFQQQNATTMAELRRLGLVLQQDRLDQQTRDREDKEIEGSISKTQHALKDIQPVMIAAKQLNNLLSNYTPETVPGVGYAKNTDIGKAFLTKEGKDVSSSIKLVGNALLKALSGTAVTAPEEVRQMAAQMADGRYDAKDFYVAWPKIAEYLNGQASVATSTLTPKARDVFIQRTGLDLSPITPRYAVEYTDGKMNLKDSRAVPAPPPGFKIN